MVLAEEGSTMSRTDEVHRITENVYKVRGRQRSIRSSFNNEYIDLNGLMSGASSADEV
jgi:hypothetical protein